MRASRRARVMLSHSRAEKGATPSSFGRGGKGGSGLVPGEDVEVVA